MYEITGIVTLLRSKPPVPPEKPCRCCPDGKGHVFSLGIDVEPQPSIYPGLMVDSVNDFIDETVDKNRVAWEGRRVRVTVELLPE